MEWTIQSGYYTSEVEDITVMIRKDHLNRDTHLYALRMASLYKEYENEIFNYVAEGIAKFNNVPQINESLRDKMKNPHIKIFSEGKGVIIWINFMIENKTVICKFENDMNLLGVEVIPEN
jgi:hypothetical protein